MAAGIVLASAAQAQCITQELPGGFVTYRCTDGRSGTEARPNPKVKPGGSAGRGTSTNTRTGIDRQLFGTKSGISKKVSPDITIHRYDGQVGVSIDRGSGVVTHHGPLFEPKTEGPPALEKPPPRPSVVPPPTRKPDPGERFTKPR